MKTILIPVDFSDHSTTTYKYAIKIAGNVVPTKLVLHHTYNEQIAIPDPDLDSSFNSSVTLNMRLIEEFKKTSENEMDSLVKEVNQYLIDNNHSNFSVDYNISGGIPSMDITDICEKIKPEFIVMGTQGVGKKEIFEGSTAKKIMNRANIPVIAVPMEDIDNNNLRIMYASNNNKLDYSKIHLLLKLFESVPTEIFIVHFNFEGNRDYDTRVITELKEALVREDVTQNLKFFIVDSSDKENALERFAFDNSINSIAFIAHKSNIFKSLFTDKISKHDFFKLGLPMIALHE
jgi:nucleotide-binding universal stress UspA family protein